MKAALWVSTLLLAVSSASLAQRLPSHTAVVSNQSQPDDAAARVERQRRYDPQAGVPTIRPGIFENSLRSINRQNLDYGAQLAKWRQVMVESTIQSVTYWTAIALAGGVLLACTYILCLLRERDRRLEITTNIVTQIINWYYYTRSHAVDAIERHNTLIEEYNTVAEQLATLRTQRRGSESWKHCCEPKLPGFRSRNQTWKKPRTNITRNQGRPMCANTMTRPQRSRPPRFRPHTGSKPNRQRRIALW